MSQQELVGDHRRFGRYLRKIREDRRMSLDAVEEMTLSFPERVTKSHLSRIENGQAVPTFPRMFALSQVYGVPISSLAEKFEIDLRREMLPDSARDKSTERLTADCKALRIAGRFTEALIIYDALIEAREERDPSADCGRLIELRFGRISCLIHLSRFASAKEECEELLTTENLTKKHQVQALQFFSMCCYRLGRFTIALIALERAMQQLAELEEPGDLRAHLAALQGNLLYLSGEAGEAIEAYKSAAQEYDALGLAFESCRARLNLVSAHIELGDHKTARRLLRSVIQEAEDHGYDRQSALALSNLALIAYKEGDLAAAETYCVRSNAVARPREFVSVIFRNCYYLLRIAEARDDDQGRKANERALRTYLSRVEKYLPEAEQYRRYLAGGAK